MYASKHRPGSTYPFQAARAGCTEALTFCLLLQLKIIITYHQRWFSLRCGPEGRNRNTCLLQETTEGIAMIAIFFYQPFNALFQNVAPALDFNQQAQAIISRR